VVAPLVGAPLGGFVTTFLAWPWIFFINLPIGLALLAAAWFRIPETRLETRRPLDWIGFILIAVAISSLVFGLELAAKHGHGPWQPACLMLIGCGTGWLALRHLNRTPQPLLDLSILRIPTFHASAIGGAGYRIACGAVPLVLPLLLQLGFGMTAAMSGSLTLFGALGGLAMKGPARVLLRRFGFRRVLILNGLISGASMFALAGISQAMPLWLIALLLLAGGFFRSLEFTALMAIAWADIPPSLASAGTSLFGLVQQVSFSAGIAYGALLLNLAAASHGVHPVASAIDFRYAFLGIGGLAALNVLAFVSLPQRAGAEVSGHRVA
jgi:predicted MFS family arabinose efflux permease